MFFFFVKGKKMLWLLMMLVVTEALVCVPRSLGRTSALLGRSKRPTNEANEDAKDDASPEKRKGSGARAARAALEALVEEETKPEKAKKTKAPKKKKEKEPEEPEEKRVRKEVTTWDEMGLDARLKLRGVAAAESAASAAEMSAAAAALEDEDLRPNSKKYRVAMDASEAAAAAVAFDSSLWPTAYLVGLDLTSRRGAAKLAESRSRREGVNGKVLEAASQTANWSIDDSLGELERLCETARLNVKGSTFQRLEKANGATLVGKGKLQEIAKILLDEKIDAVVFDDELTLAQQRNVLSEFSDCGCDPMKLQVLDRAQLVLQIFSERAKTKEAKTQVALARAEYMLPRLATFMTTGAGMELRGGSSGGRGAGSAGAYLRGAGESQLEMDKRLFTQRIQRLKSDLEDIAAKRMDIRRRKLEQAEELPLVALVGYTNAGKTSLLNALSETAEALYADDRLFATLDPTTRRVSLPGGRVCKLTDTVGFLQKLPTRLIASFRATLEEITDASLLIHVVDSSSDLAKRHVDAVNAIVSELGADDVPQIFVLNKYDMAQTNDVSSLEPDGDQHIVVRTSATNGTGIPELLYHIETALSAMNEPVHVLVPFTEGQLLNMIYTKGTIIDLQHQEAGTQIKARVPHTLRAKLQPFAVHDDDDLLPFDSSSSTGEDLHHHHRESSSSSSELSSSSTEDAASPVE